MNIIEFLKRPNRKILLSNKVSVGNTVLRNLNLNQNTDMFDVKVLKISDIAKDLVTAYDAYLGKDARTVIDAEFSRQYLENVAY